MKRLGRREFLGLAASTAAGLSGANALAAEPKKNKQGRAKMLRVSQNRRFLVYEDGKPFFYLGDTAWELFHRLNREDAEFYLQDRAKKGFTAVQAVAPAESAGLTEPNPYTVRLCQWRDRDPEPWERPSRVRRTLPIHATHVC